MNRLISIALVCLLQVSLAVASAFNLSVEVTPNGAGSLNTSGGTYEEGSAVSLRTSSHTGYVFKGWYEGETLLSSATSFSYTMPSNDAVVQARYEYDPAVPANPAMPDTTTYFSFTATVSPVGAGTLNTYSGKYVAGATVNLRTYGNTGYQFVGWQNDGGETVSTSSSFNYIMPRGDSQLTALYVYDPTVPANPDSMATRYTVTVACKPVGGGTFNTTSATAEEGGNVHLYAYTNTGYKFLRWEDETGEAISTAQNFYYVMPHGNSKVYGVFEFDPAVPGNPNKNYWNKELGEVIVDDFTPGSVGSAVSAVISGSSRNDVTMITVSGRMNDNDFGIANDYTNCTLLDLSRVTGITQVPSYAFDYTNLESVYLPATIEKIGYRAFYECKQLSSLIIYSMTPPMLENQVFTNVPEGLVVYVPASAISQYQDAEVWKDFTLLPIQEDIRSISISLPDGVNAQDYAKMWLELINTKSGQRMHYVMTDRTQYIFANIIRNTSWNVTLRNERGDVFGQIDNVEVKEEDVTVTFASLSKPQNVSLSMLTPEGNDVTSQVQVTWTDAQGNYVAQGASLSGLPVGYQVNYRMVLSQELAMAYDTPSAVEYTLKDGDNALTCQLQAIKKLTITGKVKDASTGLPLRGTVISASQTFGGKYGKTLNAKTDNNGVFTMEVFNVPTYVAIAATDYVSQTIDYSNNEFSGLTEFAVPDVSLKSITGATISVVFTYTAIEGETQNWYSDYQNVSYTLYNITREKQISQFNVQYPQIVLLEEVEDGDVLLLSATSRTNAFKAVEATITIAEQKADATFAITELGRIEASFSKTGNVSVVGSLYDASGKLVKTYNYSEAQLTINNLADGIYTLVSMGSSRLFNTIYDLAQLPQTGLLEGTDYVQNTVEVKSGVISQISIEDVPTLDESKLYYTGDNTSFTVNKSSIVVGNYLTLTGRIDFKSAYTTTVSNVQMIVDLPESCQFVENSVMVGNNTSSYTLNGNRITIPMTRYTDRVRFCVIPTLGGEYVPSAFVQFDLDGETITQPIGSANYTAKDLSISVPSTVAKTAVTISGTAIGASSIDIYDNNVLIGQTTSLANGIWATTCELNEPYNLSTHSIYAKVTTKSGMELQSETVECMYDMNAIEVSKVTMFYSNPELNQNYELVYDFQNPSTIPHRYTYYIYNKLFTFTIDFTNNDTTKVSNVVLYVKTGDGKWHAIDTQFDKNKEKWVANGEFGNMYDGIVPVNVSVGFNNDTKFVFDATFINQIFVDSEAIRHDVLDKNETDSLLEAFQTAQKEGNTELMDEIISQLIEIQREDDDYDSILDEETRLALELEADIMSDSLLIVFSNLFEGSIYLNDLTKEYIDGITIEHTQGLSLEKLISSGFESMEKNDGNIYYYRFSEDEWQFVDFSDDLYISYNPTAALSRSLNKGKDNDYGLERVKKLCETIESWGNKISNIFNDNFKKIAETTVTNEKLLKDAQEQLRFLKNFQPRTDEIVTQIIQTEGKIAKYTFRIQTYGRLSKWLEKTIKPLLTQSSKAGKIVGKSFSIFSLISDSWECYNNLRKLVDLRESVKLECIWHVEDADPHIQLRTDIYSWIINAKEYYTIKIGADIASLAGIFGGIASLLPSSGTSSSVVGVSILAIAANIGISSLFNWRLNKAYAQFVARKRNLPNLCGYDESDSDNYENDGSIESGYPDNDVPIDPSGHVYEAILSNRLAGVTATAYYKEFLEDIYGDLHENIVKWDAEEYAQENPLFTDENGFYRWDVPQGLWQVKFEKEGYETTYSEWLPVPPPQLDVNIAMKQNVQPTVKLARAFEDAVEVEFDKYMMPELLTTDNIKVIAPSNSPEGGEIAVEGIVELLNEGVSYEGSNETFASKIRFNAAQPFTAQEITLMVSNRVKSYAGIRMQDDYQQKFTIEQEIKQIMSDSLAVVGYGKKAALTVSVLPASASKGKTLSVKTSSPMILGVEADQVVIGNDGKAEITVSGELPGTAALTFSVEGTDKTAITIVNVELTAYKTVASPTVNVASGTVVEKGTAIELSCTTEGATIYYTLDGSCPCEESGNRMVYDGTPIVINENVTIKVIAVAPNMYDSEIVELTYIVDGTGITAETLDEQVQIYPLPVRDKLNVSASGIMIKSVMVTAMNGTTVAASNTAAKQITIDVSALPSGVYIVNVQTANSTFSRKVIKMM